MGNCVRQKCHNVRHTLICEIGTQAGFLIRESPPKNKMIKIDYYLGTVNAKKNILSSQHKQ